ncbi:hypothetical protein [Gardnerella vaginalis]|uniref:hypothetical protein n=1 Tax=Gardnerella vaginalis TaxID=2702 RepID=UPI0039F057DC
MPAEILQACKGKVGYERKTAETLRACLQSIENVEDIGWFGVFDSFLLRFVYFIKWFCVFDGFGLRIKHNLVSKAQPY